MVTPLPLKGSSSAPSYGYRRCDQHYQPLLRPRAAAVESTVSGPALMPRDSAVTGPFRQRSFRMRGGGCARGHGQLGPDNSR
jgi:hypothetical protein